MQCGGGNISSKSKSTNTFAQLPITSQQQNLATRVDIGSDPSIQYDYAKRREDSANSYNNPLGAATSPAVRDAAARTTNQRLAMDEANATATSKYNSDQAAFGRQATVAQMTAPTQTGGTQTSNPGIMGILGPLISAGAQVGSAFV